MISRNALWSVAGSALPGLSALASMPILFFHLDHRLFSLTSLLLSIAIFFFIYDFGLGRAVTFFSSKTTIKNVQQHGAMLGEAFFWSFLISIFSVILIAGFSNLFVDKWLHTAIEHREQTALAFKVAALGIPASLFSHLLRGILESRQDFRAASLSKVVSGTSLFIAPLFVIGLDSNDLVDISYAITISRYFGLLSYFYAAHRFIKYRDIGLKIDLASPFLKYVKWTALSGFISCMFIYGDRFVVAGYLGSETLATYILSQDILNRYLLLPWAMSAVLLPELTKNYHLGISTTATYFSHQTKISWMSVVFLLIVLISVWWGIPLLKSGLLTAEAQIIVTIQAIGIFFGALSQLPLIYLYAIGKPKLIAIIFVFEASLYVLIGPYVFENFLGTGASLVWASRMFAEYFLLNYWVRRAMS